MYPSIDKVLNVVPSKYQLVYVVAKRSHQMKETKHFQMTEKEYKNKKSSDSGWIEIKFRAKISGMHWIGHKKISFTFE